MSMKKEAEECDELISLPLGLGIDDDDVMMLMMIVGANVAASTLYPSHHSSR